MHSWILLTGMYPEESFKKRVIEDDPGRLTITSSLLTSPLFVYLCANVSRGTRVKRLMQMQTKPRSVDVGSELTVTFVLECYSGIRRTREIGIRTMSIAFNSACYVRMKKPATLTQSVIVCCAKCRCSNLRERGGRWDLQGIYSHKDEFPVRAFGSDHATQEDRAAEGCYQHQRCTFVREDLQIKEENIILSSDFIVVQSLPIHAQCNTRLLLGASNTSQSFN